MQAGLPRRVLVADDFAPLRDSVCQMLYRNGVAAVDVAGDGVGAVALAAACHPEVAILDLHMPGFDGLRAAAEISRVSPETRCILLTGSRGARHVDAALRAGIRGYVAKSDAADYLLAAVAEVARDRTFLSPRATDEL
jgi:DNA-binding NarL/FixJ family response regulator